MRVRIGWAAVLLAAAAGCGAGGPVGVAGVVKLDGKPVPRATVSFVAQGDGGRDAHGFTNEAGEFRLTTFDPNDGALPGRYKVVIGQPADEVVGGVVPGSSDDAMRAEAAGKVKTKKSAVVVPERYTRPDQTPLAQEVPAAGRVVLELTSK